MSAPVSLKEYSAPTGWRFSKTDAEVIGAQLDVMAEAGRLDQRTIVDRRPLCHSAGSSGAFPGR
jgi:hypothetical protein